jgi:ELWxxDGT repeat protein
MLVRDIYPGINESNPHNFVQVGNKLYFQANDGINGIELWQTDGTYTGTFMIDDLNAGSGNSSPANFALLSTHDSLVLLFSANDGIHGSELWAIQVSNYSSWSHLPFITQHR